MCATCAVWRASGKYDVVDARLATAEEAQFIAWTGMTARSDDQMREFAIIMAWSEHPSLDPESLSPDQWRWLERVLGVPHGAIRQAYRELLAEFDKWRRTRV